MLLTTTTGWLLGGPAHHAQEPAAPDRVMGQWLQVAIQGGRPLPVDHLGQRGEHAQRVWGWKDELPRKGLAWSGRRLRGGRASLLAPGLPVDCYRRVGERDDFRQAPLGRRLVASAGELASAFGWPRAAAGAVLEELVERGEAVGRRAHTGPRA